MNIEDSCRLFLSKIALLNTVLPVHCYDGLGGGGEENAATSSGFPWRRRASLSQRGPVFCRPPVRHLSANFFILSPLPIFIMRFLIILRFYRTNIYKLRFYEMVR